MKKTYTKPEIVFENFSLSTHVAGDCETRTNTQTEGSCGYGMRGYTLFAYNMSFCDTSENVGVASDGSPIYNDSICYHNPFDPGNLFNS